MKRHIDNISAVNSDALIGVKEYKKSLHSPKLAGRLSALWLAQKEQNSNVEHQLFLAEKLVKIMAASVQALEQSRADNVAPTLKPFTAMKRAKREPSGLRVCVGFEN